MIKTKLSDIRKQLNLPPANKIIFFDLEWTSWRGFAKSDWNMPGRHREVIQIGGVKLDYKEMFREVDSFNLLVRPNINKKLSKYIQDLTGLTQQKIDSEGIGFLEALEQFHTFCLEADYLCSNGLDHRVLIENCKLNNIECPKLFKDEINLQPLLASALGTNGEWITSGDLLQHLGLPVVGRSHDALNDARSLAAAVRFLNNKM